MNLIKINYDLIIKIFVVKKALFTKNILFDLKVDESQHKDGNRQKLRGTAPVYHLACVSNPNDLATIFELDPTSAQRVDDMVPK